MEKLLFYLVLLVLALFWLWLYRAAPGLEGLVIIATIVGIGASGCCRNAREGR